MSDNVVTVIKLLSDPGQCGVFTCNSIIACYHPQLLTLTVSVQPLSRSQVSCELPMMWVS